jgi:hypothetical protein
VINGITDKLLKNKKALGLSNSGLSYFNAVGIFY